MLATPSLDEIGNLDRMPLLTDTVKPPDPLLDFHRVPRQVEVDETMAKLEVAPLRAALRQHKNSAVAAERVGDRLAACGGVCPLMRRTAVPIRARHEAISRCVARNCVKITTPPFVPAGQEAFSASPGKHARLQGLAPALAKSNTITARCPELSMGVVEETFSEAQSAQIITLPFGCNRSSATTIPLACRETRLSSILLVKNPRPRALHLN